MTTEEKARAYDLAVKIAVEAAHKDDDKHLKSTLERIFPQLKQSENEQIRQELKDFIIWANDNGFYKNPEEHWKMQKWLVWIANHNKEKEL